MSKKVEWRPLAGYEEFYRISEYGEIWRIARTYIEGRTGRTMKLKEKLIKSSAGTQGYLHVNLRKNGSNKTLRVHRLVAQTYIPNPRNVNVVNHIDTNILNNHYTNLEWCTPGENQKHAYKTGLRKPLRGGVNHPVAKVTIAQVRKIRKLHNEKGVSSRKLAKMFPLSRHAIKEIYNYKSYKHVA